MRRVRRCNHARVADAIRRSALVARDAAQSGFTRVALFSILLAGCAVSIPPETFYALSSVESAAASTATDSRAPAPAAPASAPSVAIAVEPARLPDIVDRPQFVIWVGDAEVLPLEQQRWAEPLRAQIQRVIALDLARLLPAAHVAAGDDVLDGTDPARSYRVSLDVQRFESRPGDSSVIEVAWSVRRGTGEMVAGGRERVREAATEAGYEGVVRAHNRALAAVGRAIAAALRPVIGTVRHTGN